MNRTEVLQWRGLALMLFGEGDEEVKGGWMALRASMVFEVEGVRWPLTKASPPQGVARKGGGGG